MHNNNTIVPYISLCSGYEGIGIGLHRCIRNLRCISYCERESFAIANLVAKMEKGLLDSAPVFTDVTNFPWGDFTPYMAKGILSFGWPCQPVSSAGKRKATEDERWLFDIIADGISIMQPGMLFAENVEGLLSAKMPDGSSVFGHCIERLEKLHYKVEAGIFSASETGAPHQRKRIFILAYREEQGLEGLRELESNFLWNDIGQDGAAECELAYASGDGYNGRQLQDGMGRWKGGQLPQSQRGESGSLRGQTFGCSGELAYSENIGLQESINTENESWIGWWKQNPAAGSSSEGGDELFQYGGISVVNPNDNTNTEAGYAEADRLSGEHRPEVCAGFIGGTDAASLKRTSELADTYNSGSWEDIKPAELRTDMLEQSSGNCWNSQSSEGDQRWPSRPGQTQYAWEPPRTIGKMENGSWLGRQISSQQSRKNAVQGEWGLERDDLNNQGHGISECELEARRKTEKSNDPHSGCDAVSWGKAKWIGDKSHRRQQVEQLHLESGICDSSREQPPCSNDGFELHERRIQSNGEAQYRPGRGDTTINGIAVSNSEADECMPTNHIVDSFWKKVERFEARVMADTNDAGRQAGRDNSISDGGRSWSHGTASHCSNKARAMEDTICSGSKESKYINTSLSSEPSRSYSETMGDSSSERPRGGTQDGLGQQSEMFGERHEEVGDSECVRLQGWGEQGTMGEESCIPSGEGRESSTSAQEPIDTGGGNDESQFSKIECEMGRNSHVASNGMGMPVMSSLCDSELEEIYEWMVKCENRTDELRLLGNGVVPATATKAFITLFNKLK